MFGRTVCLLAFLVSIAVLANAKPDFFWGRSRAKPATVVAVGNRQLGDRLVLRQSMVKRSKWLRILTVEKTYEVNKSENITLVHLLDTSTNGKGASAEVVGGGPGFSNVNVLFKSRRGHGIKYQIEIYAKPF